MIKDFFKNFTLYGLVPVLNKGVGFILIPIYTHYLTPKDFGVQGIFTSFVLLMNYFINLEVYSGVGRYFYECKTLDERKILISTGLIFQLVTTIIVIVIISTNHLFINDILLSSQAYLSIYWIVILTIPFSATYGFFSVLMRYENRPKKFLIVTVLQLFVKLFFIVYFIVFLRTGIIGIFYGQLLGLIVGDSGYFFILRKYFLLKFDISKIKILLKYSLPLVPGLLIIGFEPNISKYIIRTELSIRAVGIYSFALRLVSILVLIGFALKMTWQPFFFENVKKKGSNFSKTKEIYFIFLNIFLFMCAILTLFSKEAVMLVSPKTYWEAANLVGILSLYYTAYNLKDITIIGANYSNKTSQVSYIKFLTVIIITAILYLFVRKYGILIIPVGYATAGIITLLLSMKITKKYLGIQFQWLYTILGFGFIAILNAAIIMFDISLQIRILIFFIFILSWFTLMKYKMSNYDVYLRRIFRLNRAQ